MKGIATLIWIAVSLAIDGVQVTLARLRRRHGRS